MKHITFRAPAIALGLAATLALGGCLGGGDGNTTMTGATTSTSGAALPSSALASVDGFFAFMQQLVATAPAFDEPLQLGDSVTLPTSNAEATAF